MIELPIAANEMISNVIIDNRIQRKSWTPSLAYCVKLREMAAPSSSALPLPPGSTPTSHHNKKKSHKSGGLRQQQPNSVFLPPSALNAHHAHKSPRKNVLLNQPTAHQVMPDISNLTLQNIFGASFAVPIINGDRGPPTSIAAAAAASSKDQMPISNER